VISTTNGSLTFFMISMCLTPLKAFKRL